MINKKENVVKPRLFILYIDSICIFVFQYLLIEEWNTAIYLLFR